MDALRTLGAEEPAIAAGFPTTVTVLWSGTGKRLGDAVVSTTLDDGTTGYTMKRADLYMAMHDQAATRGVAIEHGKSLVAVENVDGRVRAIFADGSDATGDILIGCDGIHSTVRRIIDPSAPPPAYAELLNLGGYVRGVQVDADPGTYHMIFGRRAFFGYAVAPDAEVWWFANVPQRDEPDRGSLARIGTDAWRQRLIELFADDALALWSRLRDEVSATASFALGLVTACARRARPIGQPGEASAPTPGTPPSVEPLPQHRQRFVDPGAASAYRRRNVDCAHGG